MVKEYHDHWAKNDMSDDRWKPPETTPASQDLVSKLSANGNVLTFDNPSSFETPPAPNKLPAENKSYSTSGTIVPLVSNKGQ